MGKRHAIEMETVSRPRAEYQTDEYFELDLPAAPAIMVGEELEVEAAICRRLGLPALVSKNDACVDFPSSRAFARRKVKPYQRIDPP